MKFDTEAIHSFYDPYDHNRAIMPPIYQNSMFCLKGIDDNASPFRYSRLSNPTRQVLEKTVAALEGGKDGFACASGMAGIDLILRTFLRPGDTIIAVADIYGGAYDLLTGLYASWGVNVVFSDLTVPENLTKALQNTPAKMLWLETPSNPLLRLVDIETLSRIAKSHGVIVAVDNTFATPYLQNPLQLGADIVFHSATKYLSGHSDVLMGVVVSQDKKHSEQLLETLITTGVVAGPMDCALVLRGIKTLSVRMQQHVKNAHVIAQKLTEHPAVEQVFYPALPNHEHAALAKKQMKDAGGVVSVYLKNNTREAANTVIDKLKLFHMAASLGGVESLVNHTATQSHSGMNKEYKESLGIREGLLRFSIGIEDVDDIWDDLNQALNALL